MAYGAVGQRVSNLNSLEVHHGTYGLSLAEAKQSTRHVEGAIEEQFDRLADECEIPEPDRLQLRRATALAPAT